VNGIVNDVRYLAGTDNPTSGTSAWTTQDWILQLAGMNESSALWANATNLYRYHYNFMPATMTSAGGVGINTAWTIYQPMMSSTDEYTNNFRL